MLQNLAVAVPFSDKISNFFQTNFFPPSNHFLPHQEAILMGPNASALSGKPPNEDPPASLPAFKAPEIDLSELTPVGLLHESEDSRVVQARRKEKDCVLKIVSC